MKQFKLTVQPREGAGRGVSRRLRASGKIPAVIYGKLNEPRSLAVDGPEFTRLVKQIAGTAAIIEIEQGSEAPRLSVIQEVQRDPMTDKVLHIDLHEISATEKMSLDINVHLVGESYGVKNESGTLDIVSHQVTIRCLPQDLPEFIEVDVTELRLGQTIHIKELKALPGVEFLDDADQPVVSCVAEAAPAEEPTPAAAAAAAAPAAPAAAAAKK
jgi:large subunit ribosomal protein L25